MKPKFIVYLLFFLNNDKNPQIWIRYTYQQRNFFISGYLLNAIILFLSHTPILMTLARRHYQIGLNKTLAQNIWHLPPFLKSHTIFFGDFIKFSWHFLKFSGHFLKFFGHFKKFYKHFINFSSYLLFCKQVTRK